MVTVFVVRSTNTSINGSSSDRVVLINLPGADGRPSKFDIVTPAAPSD